MKKIITGIAVILLMVLAFTACQKDNTGPENKITDTQLTPQQVQLKKGMQQAAIVIAQIAKNKDIQKEVQNLINRGMYNDDYIKFKDLFYPQSNPKLKSTSTTLFARAFKKVVNSGNYEHLKSSDVSDLEKFLVDNNLVLYVPYPVSDYPENMRTPTATYNPLDNDSVSTGYVISDFKSTNSIETVSKVDESYSEEHPVYIITPNLADADPGSGSSGSGSGSGSTVTEVKVGEIYCKGYIGGLFSGGLDLRILRSKANPIDINNGKVTGSFVDAIPFYLKRKYVRYAKHGWEKGWYTVNTAWNTNWKPEDTQLAMVVYAKETNKKITITATGKVKIGSSEYGYTATEEYETGYSRLIGVMEWDRNWFFATNKIGDGNYFGGSEFRNGWPIRAISPQFWMTTPVRKFN